MNKLLCTHAKRDRLNSLTRELQVGRSGTAFVRSPARVVSVVVSSHGGQRERVLVLALLQIGAVVGQLHVVVLVPVHLGRRVSVDLADELHPIAGAGVHQQLLDLHLRRVLYLHVDKVLGSCTEAVVRRAHVLARVVAIYVGHDDLGGVQELPAVGQLAAL